MNKTLIGKIVNKKSDYTFHIIVKIYKLYLSLWGPSMTQVVHGPLVGKHFCSQKGSFLFNVINKYGM